MAVRTIDIVVISLVLLISMCAALKVDLAALLKGRHKSSYPLQKRHTDGNPCTEPEKPFPCKETSRCIPMGYVCDDNIDCDDGYDEDPDVCTAAHRPPVEDIMRFLQAEKSWIVPKLFAGKNVGKIAHALAVSQTVSDFKRRVGLSSRDVKNLCLALDAVNNNNEEELEALGMPLSTFSEFAFFFSKLMKSGFNC